MTLQNAYSSRPLYPEYHSGLLLVQVQPARLQPRRMGIAAEFSLESMVVGDLPVGMAALSHFERAGLVKRVIPVGRPASAEAGIGAEALVARAPGGYRASAAIMASAVSTEQKRLDAGLSLIELQRDQDVEALRQALASDPTVQNVSRVPVRYLLARRKPSAKKAGTVKAGAGVAKAAPTTQMWNLEKIKWAQARARSGFKDAGAIKVAVLDTGIDQTHPDLQGHIGPYVYDHPDLPTASSAQDIIGHGTHVAGTIAASINSVGINGICTCQLNIWKIFDDIPDLDSPQAPTEFAYFVDPAMYLRALIDCQERGMDVVNLSIGGGGTPDFAETQAFSRLLANGTVVVAAMGNERQWGSPTSYPAALPSVIAVGATNIVDRVAVFSNRGNHISVCAPGVAIWSTLPLNPGQFGFEAVSDGSGNYRQGKPKRRETDYDAWDGTSMASPHVAAAVALHLANGGNRGAPAVSSALGATVDKVPAMGGRDFDADYGHGRLNLDALVKRAQGG